MTSFADITTMGVDGPVVRLTEPTTYVGLIGAAEEAGSKGLSLIVVGGGSNPLISNKPFDGMVARGARRLVTVPGEAAPVEGEDHIVYISTEADANWDNLVTFTVEPRFEGVEGLSGIPDIVGTSMVQNIGVHGREVATSIESVEIWD